MTYGLAPHAVNLPVVFVLCRRTKDSDDPVFAELLLRQLRLSEGAKVLGRLHRPTLYLTTNDQAVGR